MTLSKEANELLQDNSYQLKQSGEGLEISRWSLDRIVLHVFLLLFMLFMGVVATSLHLGLGVIAWLLIAAVAVWQYENSKRKIKFSINKYSRAIQVANVNLKPSGIESLDFNSQFVASYTSAFKDTNEEHNISICITTANGHTYEVINFKSDYAEPCEAIREIGSLIKNEIAQLRPAI